MLSDVGDYRRFGEVCCPENVAGNMKFHIRNVALNLYCFRQITGAHIVLLRENPLSVIYFHHHSNN
jgi:hypothetical protein